MRCFSEQNLDGITTEALRVRTGAIVYARFNIFRRNGSFERKCTDSVGLNSEALSAFTSSFSMIRKIFLPPIGVKCHN